MKGIFPKAGEQGPPRWLAPGVFALFFAIAFLLYLPALPGPFVLDDAYNIEENFSIRVSDFSCKSIQAAAFGGPVKTRPLAYLSFALNHYFSGLDTRPFRAVNVFFHALTAFGLFLFLFALSQTPGMQDTKKWAFGFAFWAALLWLLHPVATQSVNYIVQRMAIMAALFFVFSLYFFVRARLTAAAGKKRAFFGLCAFFGVLAFLSKENAAMLVFVLLLVEWFFFQNLSRSWFKRALLFAAPAAGIFFALVLIYTGGNPFGAIIQGYEWRDFTPYERILTQFRVVSHYFFLIVFPLPSQLKLFHDIEASTSLFNPIATLSSFLFLAGLFVFAVLSARRLRMVSFALLFFFIMLLPESSIIALELIFDHRAYLPSMMIVAAGVWVVMALAGGKRAGIALLAGVAVLFSWGAFSHNRVWGDAETFFRDAVRRSPTSSRAVVSLANQLHLNGKLEEALVVARHATELDEKNFWAWRILGGILAQSEINLLDESIEAYREALKHESMGHDFRTLSELQLVLAMAGRFEEARQVLGKALKARPDDPGVLCNAGRHMIYAGQPDKALVFLQRAIDLLPDYAPAHDNMGEAYARLGLWEKALESYKQALFLGEETPWLLNNLGTVYLNLNRIEEARKSYEKALAINPALVGAFEGLGLLELRLGNLKKAGDLYARGLEIAPDSTVLLQRAAEAAYLARDFAAAGDFFEKIARLDPDGQTGRMALGQARQMRHLITTLESRIANADVKLAQDPENLSLWMSLGNLYKEAGKWQEAQKAYEKVLAATPDSTDVIINLGLASVGLEDYQQAQRLYESVLEREPENIFALYNMACLFSRTNNTAEAAKWLERLFETGFNACASVLDDNDLINLRQSEQGERLMQNHCDRR
ncbi:MAG: tetratricopeptide repeat protein [Desulfatibacillaceae bacterium]|nr:tetratricopeptide repeat protein [Desulfatibacillaceae bacterium]